MQDWTCHFLALEDNADDAALLENAFARTTRKTSVFICRNVAEAKAYLKGAGMYVDRKKYPVAHVIITDLNMTTDGGCDFVAWVRSNPEYARVPVVVITGSSSPRERNEALGAGANEVLEKPLSLTELRVLVNRLAEFLCP